MKSISFLFLFAAFLAIQPSAAQTCNCPEYSTLKEKWASSEDDIAGYINQLRTSPGKLCKAKADEWMAVDFMENGKYDSSDLFFRKAEEKYRQTGCNDSVLVSLYKNWAQLYYTNADFGKAQEYSFKLLKAAELSGNPHEMAVCYTMIAQLFNQTGQADKGVVFTRKAIPLADKVTDPVKKSDLFYKIAKRYLWHFQDTKISSSLDSSELFTIRQLEVARSINRKSALAAGFSNLQGIAWERGDLRKALVLLDSSFTYTDKDEDDVVGTNYFDKADIYVALKDYPKAALMADSALFYRLRDANPVYTAEVYELISRINLESGNYKGAYEFREKGRAITDSVRNIEKIKEVSELEKKYSQEKNENKIKDLARQKQVYLLLAIAGLLGLAVLGFFIRQQSLRNKQKILETEQRLNRARMNPHFFFNALTSLQLHALEENDGKTLASNISKFSHIMRETLESTYKEYVTIAQEKDFLEEYMELQSIRIPDRFRFSVTYGTTIEPEDTIIPSMILQPFVENSIEHGFAGIDYAGQVDIHFDQAPGELLVRISDNGKGLLNGPKENNEHISRASQIIKDRIYLLNIKLRTKASFSIDNNAHEKGVTVLIRLPLLYKDQVR
ncbi:MAG TPA: histidine kinase [Chitinophagaceae bacterium]|nr:histidine kinase [Chitinophagaceae bacterium]HPH30605.1 histidine kinase [Chitinophagaceae bacterium]HPN57741.1 histidine kinase [Chitinophagaceae bacterium]